MIRQAVEGMNEEQLEFPVVPGKKVKKAKVNGLDFEARVEGRYFCPQCGQDAAHAIVSNYYLCDKCNFDYGMTAREYFAQKPGKPEG
jgi:ribosomal protein L37AE/L43A